MDGKDCNWEPSNFNAKNLNADGEIYLVSGAYILIYPYINECAKDYFKVSVVESNELSTQLKNGIENIFNKFKTILLALFSSCLVFFLFVRYVNNNIK